ncbi:hypothetical protein M752DRAFT_128006 [Aspergillus phoenicis ATCC 13157]|uniref:Uncharacterized protein n=1 Tax=Aspergillus phoenicis ATCC 13157 TaxID=1353007 RepID=A0A370PRM8_ASPPH|nr:hypothetical protein M752DRAFT_128006 [Aspergillus phoenicis ATCC 13157]
MRSFAQHTYTSRNHAHPVLMIEPPPSPPTQPSIAAQRHANSPPYLAATSRLDHPAILSCRPDSSRGRSQPASQVAIPRPDPDVCRTAELHTSKQESFCSVVCRKARLG